MEAVTDHANNPETTEDSDEGFVDLPVMSEGESQYKGYIHSSNGR